jgi:hypothetical protein
MSSRFDDLAAAFAGTSLTYEFYPPPLLMRAALKAVGDAGDLNTITRYDPEDALDDQPAAHTYERLAIDELGVIPISGGVVMHVGREEREVIELVIKQADSFVIIMKGTAAVHFIGLFPPETLMLVSLTSLTWRRCVSPALGSQFDTAVMFISDNIADDFWDAGPRLEMARLSILDRN